MTLHPKSLTRSCRNAALVAALAICGHAARAEEPLVTDRPDFVESSDVVGRGRAQIETGIVFERNRADGTRSRGRSTPALLRIGVSDSVELRVETDGFLKTSTHDLTTGDTQRDRGFADAALGVKWRMQAGDEAAGTPAIAWLVHLDLNSGSSAYRGQGVRPSLRMVAEWDLPGGYSIGAMPGVYADNNDAGRRYAAGLFAVTLGKEWTPAWRSFVELAAQRLAAKKSGGSAFTFDAGVAYLVSSDVQVDLSMARGLNANAPDLQWGVGFSVRF